MGTQHVWNAGGEAAVGVGGARVNTSGCASQVHGWPVWAGSVPQRVGNKDEMLASPHRHPAQCISIRNVLF